MSVLILYPYNPLKNDMITNMIGLKYLIFIHVKTLLSIKKKFLISSYHIPYWYCFYRISITITISLYSLLFIYHFSQLLIKSTQVIIYLPLPLLKWQGCQNRFNLNFFLGVQIQKSQCWFMQMAWFQTGKNSILPLIARFMGSTWGPPGSWRPQVSPM